MANNDVRVEREVLEKGIWGFAPRGRSQLWLAASLLIIVITVCVTKHIDTLYNHMYLDGWMD